MPAFCLADRIGIEEVAQVAGRHPALPIILAGIQYRTHRVLLPLLNNFSNVYVSIGSNYTVHKGVETLVDAVGPERLLFGTGFPQVEPMTGVTVLMYAALSDDARQLIGAGNMERLMERIVG